MKKVEFYPKLRLSFHLSASYANHRSSLVISELESLIPPKKKKAETGFD
jgi:hypothetical protein